MPRAHYSGDFTPETRLNGVAVRFHLRFRYYLQHTRCRCATAKKRAKQVTVLARLKKNEINQKRFVSAVANL